MHLVLPSEMQAGTHYRVSQEFSTGTTVVTEGTLFWVNDGYAQFPGVPLLNLHPHAGMPNVHIWEYKS
jgi:hypothetical protein